MLGCGVLIALYNVSAVSSGRQFKFGYYSFTLPNLIGSRGIDGPKQYRASTFCTLVIKHGVYGTTFSLLVGHDTLFITVLFQLMLLHLRWLEMPDTRLLTASHLYLFCKNKKCLTFEGLQHQTQYISLKLSH